MGKLAATIAAPAAPKLIAWGDLVYRVRRVDSDDLRRVGFAALEGSASVREAETELRRLQREARARISKLTPEEAIVELEKAAAREAEIAEQRLVAVLGRPEGQTALLDRYDAYICAAITGAGRLLATTERRPPGVVVDADDPAKVLEDLRDQEEIEAGKEPVYIEAIRFSQREAEHDPDRGVVWIHALSEDQRRLLGAAIGILQSVTGALVPFRLEPRGPADPGETVSILQQAPERDHGLGSGGSGAGPVGDGGGRDGEMGDG